MKDSDEYKKEIDKLTSSTNNNTIDKDITSEKVNPDERDNIEYKIQRKNESIKDKLFGKMSEFIFVAVVGEPLASIANTVFVAAIVGSFTLVGIIVSHSFLKK
jgi:hypothetical protein